MSMIWIWAFVLGVSGELICKIKPSGRLERFWRGAARIHQELWPFAAPGILVWAVTDWNGDSPWRIVFDAMNLFNWWHYRNWPEDSHWKRRGRKAKEAIERRAGRLVVVPVTGGN